MDTPGRAWALLTLLLAIGCFVIASGTADQHQTTLSRRRQLELFPGVSAVNTVFYNGLSPSWRSASYGCVDCNFSDNLRRYSGSTQSIYAEVQPWAALVLETTAPFAGQGVLNFMIRGSGITRSSFRLEDTVQQRYSRSIRFANPTSVLNSTGLTVLGSDDDGWIRMQVNLNNLTTSDVNANMKVNQGTWNRLVWSDVSGVGFKLQLDQIKIIATGDGFNAASLDFSNAIPANMFSIPPVSVPTTGGLDGDFLLPSNGFFPPTSMPSTPAQPAPVPDTGSNPTSPAPVNVPIAPSSNGPKLPVLNIDLASDASSPSKFIMRLKPNVTLGAIRSICNEMADISLPAGFTAPRFTGACGPLPDDLFNAAASDSKPVGWRFQSFSVNSMADLDAMRSLLSSQADYFERDLVASTSELLGTTLDATYNVRYWNLDRLDQTSLPLDGTYNPGSLNGAGSHVYVIDTGLRWSHQDFSGRVGDGTSMISDSYWDDHGHGTHVAGIAVGSVHGVAKQATIHSVKVLNSQGSGSYTDIINGLGWVKNHVQNNGFRQAVVVMSLGGPRASSLNDAVEDLANAGIMVSVAAGNNNGGDTCSYSPSSAPSAIAVGASDSQDVLASFSNIGACVFMFAPGVSITSASYSGDNMETTMSGTSMAAPLVGGIVALYLQYQPGASVSDVKTALDRAAPRITFDSSSPSRLANAQSSRLEPSSSPAPTPAPTPVSSPTPTPAPTTSLLSPFQFPSFSSPTKPAWCSTCSWCMFC